MKQALVDFFEKKEEPLKSCLLALREIILQQDEEISEDWKYGIPFFNYRGKRVCYVWIYKKTMQPYLGIVEGKRIEHPQLVLEKRTKMKIILFDPRKDLPLSTILTILDEALRVCKKDGNTAL